MNLKPISSSDSNSSDTNGSGSGSSSSSSDIHEEGKEAIGPPAAGIRAVLDAMEGEEDEGKYDDVELEETECPLCHFMRASPCGRTWVRWEKCIHAHKSKDEDFVNPCARITLRLAECIQKHQDDFPPTLRNALLGGGAGGEEEEEEGEEGGKEEVGGKEEEKPALKGSLTVLHEEEEHEQEVALPGGVDVEVEEHDIFSQAPPSPPSGGGSP